MPQTSAIFLLGSLTQITTVHAVDIECTNGDAVVVCSDNQVCTEPKLQGTCGLNGGEKCSLTNQERQCGHSFTCLASTDPTIMVDGICTKERRNVGESCGGFTSMPFSEICADDLKCFKDTSTLTDGSGICVEDINCPAIVEECQDGTFVSPNPENNCKFDACPPGVCQQDIQECGPDSPGVGRNPENNCEFFDCLILKCTEELTGCPDGSSVGRNPLKNCEFDACPVSLQTESPKEPATPNPVEPTPCQPSVDNDKYCKCPPPVIPASGDIQISVCGDATFLIPEGSIPCSGETLLDGAVCPSKDATTTLACQDRNIMSFFNGGKTGTCKAPANAECKLLNTGAYGCIFPGNANTVNACLDELPVNTDYQAILGVNGYPLPMKNNTDSVDTTGYASPLSVDLGDTDESVNTDASDAMNTSVYALTMTSLLAIVLLATL